MSWNIKWSEVNTQDETIPVGSYTFELAPGARYNEAGALKFSVTVVDGGEFTGRRLFPSFPNPEGTSAAGKSFAWSKTCFKRLITAIGVEPEEGEAEDHYLNRVAGSRFRSSIKHRVSEEYPQPQAELNLFNFGPAA